MSVAQQSGRARLPVLKLMYTPASAPSQNPQQGPQESYCGGLHARRPLRPGGRQVWRRAGSRSPAPRRRVPPLAVGCAARAVLPAPRQRIAHWSCRACLTGLPEQPQQRPEVVLGHYCAILTSLTLSASGRLLATTDRCAVHCALDSLLQRWHPDRPIKTACASHEAHNLQPAPAALLCHCRDQHVRVSVVPADPAGGAHEIQSFCLGHTSFVTCSTFAAEGEQVRRRAGIRPNGCLRMREQVLRCATLGAIGAWMLPAQPGVRP